MDRELIIRLAVQAGITPWTKNEWSKDRFVQTDEGMDGDVACLIQFAALVAAHGKKPSGSFVLWENTLCNPLADPRSMAHSAWHDGYASGVKAEREECAKVCDEEANDLSCGEDWNECGGYLAKTIRSRT